MDLLKGIFKKSYQNIEVTEMNEMLKNFNTVLLDVRTEAEIKEMKIPGSIAIDFFDKDFKSKVSKLDKSKAYILYCRSGNRSVMACNIMAENGFSELYNLSGGIGAYMMYNRK